MCSSLQWASKQMHVKVLVQKETHIYGVWFLHFFLLVQKIKG